VKKHLTILFLAAIVAACDRPSQSEQADDQAPVIQTELSLPFEKYQLDNGLTVILHQDKSDPIVALATIVHVGSNREKPGRTGFAHFFEHMSFNDSENVPQGANRKMIEELGGTRNGGTWTDGTIYYEVIPKDALEKLMWIDSDRLGYMINTVTEDALEREKQVVKNEKRQRVDNQPYGHTEHVILKNLYPESHPYNWTVIGDLADLQAATLQDVKQFYSEYYGPGNATLVIAGDIDIDQTKALVARWFGEIKPSAPVTPIKAQAVSLSETKKRYHLDTFAKVPELRMTLPTVEQYHPDSYALSALAEILSDGKRAVLYKELVEKRKLAPAVSARQDSNEVAGTFTVRVRANANVDLDEVYAAVQSALADFEQNGFSDTDLMRIKARQETQFYNGIASVLNKAFQLGIYNEFAGDPGFISQDIANIKAVSRSDILRVYEQYIKGKPYILTSFVPKDQAELIVEQSEKASVEEEEIVAGAEKQFDASLIAEYEKTPSKYDRSEPALGPTPLVTSPQIHDSTLTNGMRLLNIAHTELPVVNFTLSIKGGAWLESPQTLGAANLLAEWMNEGTATLSPAELEDAIGLLGATIRVSANSDGFYFSGNTLARNFPATMALMTDMLLHPRFDAAEFARLKSRQLTALKQQEAQPFTVASRAFYRQLYGDNHRAGLPTDGSSASVEALTMEQLKTFYADNLSPKNATLQVVGDINQSQIVQASNALIEKWQGDAVALPQFPAARIPSENQVYFIDIPDAKQSVIVAGKPALSGNDANYYPLLVAQNRLGGGGSARLFQTLRIAKGYTYGAYSSLSRRIYDGPFLAYSQVRSNVTKESLDIFRELIGQYDETFTESDLATTKNLLVKQNTRDFETMDQLLNMLQQISQFDLPLDYVNQQQQHLQTFTLEQLQQVYRHYADEKQMIYVVVGDAATQLARVKEFADGKVTVLDRDGNKI
jgi:zinc protease